MLLPLRPDTVRNFRLRKNPTICSFPQGNRRGIAGGKGGIRTLGTLSRTHDFQSCTFGHSVTFPQSVRSEIQQNTEDALRFQVLFLEYPQSAKSIELESAGYKRTPLALPCRRTVGGILPTKQLEMASGLNTTISRKPRSER